jgi:hypothetical protein
MKERKGRKLLSRKSLRKEKELKRFVEWGNKKSNLLLDRNVDLKYWGDGDTCSCLSYISITYTYVSEFSRISSLSSVMLLK